MTNTKEIKLTMPKASMDRLEAIKARTEAETYSEVMRNALRLYEALILEAERGGELYMKTAEDGEVKIKPIF